MSKATITGDYYEDYLEKKKNWRKRLLEFSVDPSLPEANEDSRQVPTLTKVNGRNYRRAIMHCIARESAISTSFNFTDSTPNVLGSKRCGAGHLSTNRCPSNPRFSTYSVPLENTSLDMGMNTVEKLIKKGKKSSNLLTRQNDREYVTSVDYYYELFEKLYADNDGALNALPEFSGGIDGGTEISFYGDWFHDDEEKDARLKWGVLTTRLDELKQTAQNKEGDFVSFKIGNEDWQVMPTGSGTGVKYKWLIKRGGASIAIHSNPKKNIAPIHVKLEYEALYGETFDRVMAKIETVLTQLGFHIDRDVVSRVDLQVTLAGVSFNDEVVKAYLEDRFVTRIAGEDPHKDRGVWETLTWGNRKNRKVQVCVYNKFREAFKSASCNSLGQKAVDLLNVFGPNVGGYFGYLKYSQSRDDMLVRVEFRLFRDFLRLHNIESHYDLLEDMPKLIKYLTEDYFKVVKKSKNDNTHYYESGFDDWWQKVINAFNEVFVAGRSIVTKRDRRVSAVALGDLIKQFSGCVTSALSKVPYIGKDGDEDTMTFSVFYSMLLSIIHDEAQDMYKDYVRKRKQYRGNLEPLDMTDIVENVSRKMSAREQRQERLAKDKQLEKAMLEKHLVVRSDVSDRDYDGCEQIPYKVQEWLSIDEASERYGRA